MTGGQDEAAEHIDTSEAKTSRNWMTIDEVNNMVRKFDARIDELRLERDEARGVAAQLLDESEAERHGSRAYWLHDFPWLKEYTR